jgi:NAD(P)-dependent dehydrogenase (short-subunit alcohol dehydrogenase family)
MTILHSLRDGYRAAVFGASGGLGAAFVRALAEDPRCAAIHAGARRSIEGGGKITPFRFDLLDEASIALAAGELNKSIDGVDLVLVATGVLHHAELKPEKTMRSLQSQSLAQSYALNAIGPALIAKHVLPLMPRERRSVFAAMSARVGSISDNRSGGWHAYRASKAALNQLVRTCAIELAMKSKYAVCVTLHPGTVDGAMSKPFQAGVAPGKLFSAENSARHLLAVIDQLSASESGGFFAWDGQRIQF